MNKILFTSTAGAPTLGVGGPNKIILEIIRHLDLNKYDIGYFSSHYSNFKLMESDIKSLIKSNVSPSHNLRTYIFNHFDIYRRLVSNRWYWNIFNLKNTIKFKKNLNNFNRYDILHAHDALSFFNLRKLKGKKILTFHSKGPIVMDMQDYFGNKILFNNQINSIKHKEIESFKYADIITFPSYSARDLFLSFYKIQNNPKIKVIYNGVDIQKIESENNCIPILKKIPNLSNYELLLLNIAEHIKPKRTDLILEVIRSLVYEKKKEVLFINVGKGPETIKLKRLVTKYNIQKNVIFLSSLTNSEVICLMKNFNFLLSFSERVIFDLVILEAMACGMTVLASDDGGNKEIIKNAYNGYLVNPKEINDCVNCVLNFDQRIKMNAINSVKNYSIENMISNFSEIYENSY